MADQQPAKLIVIPLLLQLPDPALGLVELGDQLEAALAGVVADHFLEKRLVEIEAVDTVALSLRELLEKTGEQVSGLVALLDEADYLVDLVGNHVSILVLVDSLPAHLLLDLVRVVVAVNVGSACCPHWFLFATAPHLARKKGFLDFKQGVTLFCARLSRWSGIRSFLVTLNSQLIFKK